MNARDAKHCNVWECLQRQQSRPEEHSRSTVWNAHRPEGQLRRGHARLWWLGLVHHGSVCYEHPRDPI
jgi:hypothetical protein